MRMIEIDYEAQPPIDGYGPGGFRIGGNWHEGSILLMPEGLLPIPHQLSVKMLAPVVKAADTLDVLLIGMGADIAPLPRDVRECLEDAGIGSDIMATPSACRTYNILLTEDRRVAALLLAV